MAFMLKSLIDLRGILFLMLLTATSQATNLDCNGKAFHCVNSTHFMICVDLGGISTTIDDLVIPCPPPTECQLTNRYECEFPVPSTTIVTTISEVNTDTPLVTTEIPYDQYFDTVRTTTLPAVNIALAVEPILRKPELLNFSITEHVTDLRPNDQATIHQDIDQPLTVNNIDIGIQHDGAPTFDTENIVYSSNQEINITKDVVGTQKATRKPTVDVVNSLNTELPIKTEDQINDSTPIPDTTLSVEMIAGVTSINAMTTENSDIISNLKSEINHTLSQKSNMTAIETPLTLYTDLYNVTTETTEFAKEVTNYTISTESTVNLDININAFAVTIEEGTTSDAIVPVDLYNVSSVINNKLPNLSVSETELSEFTVSNKAINENPTERATYIEPAFNTTASNEKIDVAGTSNSDKSANVETISKYSPDDIDKLEININEFAVTNRTHASNITTLDATVKTSVDSYNGTSFMGSPNTTEIPKFTATETAIHTGPTLNTNVLNENIDFSITNIPEILARVEASYTISSDTKLNMEINKTEFSVTETMNTSNITTPDLFLTTVDTPVAHNIGTDTLTTAKLLNYTVTDNAFDKTRANTTVHIVPDFKVINDMDISSTIVPEISTSVATNNTNLFVETVNLKTTKFVVTEKINSSKIMTSDKVNTEKASEVYDKSTETPIAAHILELAVIDNVFNQSATDTPTHVVSTFEVTNNTDSIITSTIVPKIFPNEATNNRHLPVASNLEINTTEFGITENVSKIYTETPDAIRTMTMENLSDVYNINIDKDLNTPTTTETPAFKMTDNDFNKSESNTQAQFEPIHKENALNENVDITNLPAPEVSANVTTTYRNLPLDLNTTMFAVTENIKDSTVTTADAIVNLETNNTKNIQITTVIAKSTTQSEVDVTTVPSSTVYVNMNIMPAFFSNPTTNPESFYFANNSINDNNTTPTVLQNKLVNLNTTASNLTVKETEISHTAESDYTQNTSLNVATTVPDTKIIYENIAITPFAETITTVVSDVSDKVKTLSISSTQEYADPNNSYMSDATVKTGLINIHKNISEYTIENTTVPNTITTEYTQIRDLDGTKSIQQSKLKEFFITENSNGRKLNFISNDTMTLEFVYNTTILQENVTNTNVGLQFMEVPLLNVSDVNTNNNDIVTVPTITSTTKFEPVIKTELLSTVNFAETFATESTFTTPTLANTALTTEGQAEDLSLRDIKTHLYVTTLTSENSVNVKQIKETNNTLSSTTTATEIFKNSTNMGNTKKISKVYALSTTETSTTSSADNQTTIKLSVLEKVEILKKSPGKFATNPTYIQSDAENIELTNPFKDLGGNTTDRLVQKEQSLSIGYENNSWSKVSKEDINIDTTPVSTLINETSMFTAGLSSPNIRIEKDAAKVPNNSTKSEFTNNKLNDKQIKPHVKIMSFASHKNDTDSIIANNDSNANTENTTLSDMKNNILIETTTSSFPKAITDQSILFKSVESQTPSIKNSTVVPLVVTDIASAAFITMDNDITETMKVVDESTVSNMIDLFTDKSNQIITTHNKSFSTNKTINIDSTTSTNLLPASDKTTNKTLMSGLVSSSTVNLIKENVAAMQDRMILGQTTVTPIPFTGIATNTDLFTTTPGESILGISESDPNMEPKYITTHTPIVLYMGTDKQFLTEIPTVLSTDSSTHGSNDYSISDLTSEIIKKVPTTIYEQQEIKRGIDNSPILPVLNLVNKSIPEPPLTNTETIFNSNGQLANVNNKLLATTSSRESTTSFDLSILSNLVTKEHQSTNTKLNMQLFKQENLPTTTSEHDNSQFKILKITQKVKGHSFNEIITSKNSLENITDHTPSNIQEDTSSRKSAEYQVLIFNQSMIGIGQDTVARTTETNGLKSILAKPGIINKLPAADSTNQQFEGKYVDTITLIKPPENKVDRNIKLVNILEKQPRVINEPHEIMQHTLTSTVSTLENTLSTTNSHLDTQSKAYGNANAVISDKDKITTKQPGITNIAIHNKISAIENKVSTVMPYNFTRNLSIQGTNSVDNGYSTSAPVTKVTETLTSLKTKEFETTTSDSTQVYGAIQEKSIQKSSNIISDQNTINYLHAPDNNQSIEITQKLNTNIKSQTKINSNTNLNVGNGDVQTQIYTSSNRNINPKEPALLTMQANKSFDMSSTTTTAIPNIAPPVIVTTTNSPKPLKPAGLPTVIPTRTVTVTGNQALSFNEPVESSTNNKLILHNETTTQSTSETNQIHPTTENNLQKLSPRNNSENISPAHTKTNNTTGGPILHSTAVPTDILNLGTTIIHTHLVNDKHPKLNTEQSRVKLPDIQIMKPTEIILSEKPYSETNSQFSVNSDVIVVQKLESEKTHSGIITSIPIPFIQVKEKSKILEKMEKPEKSEQSLKSRNKGKAEDDEGKSINIELASLQDKISLSNYANITKTNENKKNIINTGNDTGTREELLITPENNAFGSNISHNIAPSSPKYKTYINFHNDTNSAVSGYKTETPTYDLIVNNTSRNDTHTSNSKSQDQNTSIPRARNTTVISNDQSATSSNLSQTKSAAGVMQTTEFPAKESPTQNTNKSKFSCGIKRGRYSDEHDCRKFYICQGNDKAVEKACPVNTVFSEINKQCTKNLSHCIRNNQFRCVAEGRFSDFLNDNVYYICVKNNLSHFIRFKLQCQNGYRLNKTSVRCELNTESTSTIESSNSASELSSSSDRRETREISKKRETHERRFKCKKEGVFPDPSNCRKYFVCTETDDSEYRQRRKKCDSGEIFHKDKKKCVDRDSYEC